MLEGAGVSCAHHDPEVRLVLRTLHSDSHRPDQLVGEFECPECGDRRRFPLNLEDVTPEPQVRIA